MSKDAERHERLAAALRANLRKRKAQGRSPPVEHDQDATKSAINPDLV